MYWPHFLGLFTLHNGTCVTEELECFGWNELPDYDYAYYYNDVPYWWKTEWEYKYIDYMAGVNPYDITKESDYYKEIDNTPCSWTCRRWYKLENGECVFDNPCRYMIWEEWSTNTLEWVYKSRLCIDWWNAYTDEGWVIWEKYGGNQCHPYYSWKCQKKWRTTVECKQALPSINIQYWESYWYPYDWWFYSSFLAPSGYGSNGAIGDTTNITINMGYYTWKDFNNCYNGYCGPLLSSRKTKTFKWWDTFNKNFDNVYETKYYNFDPWFVEFDNGLGYRVISPVFPSNSNMMACPEHKKISFL